MSTISDVAKAAGVSESTVSRALRGLDRVNPATRERVLHAARRLEYVASPTAASLASGRTKVIGVVTPFLARWYFATLISGIEKSLREHEHHALLFDLEDASFGKRRQLTSSLLWKRVDGIIVLAMPTSASEQALLARLELPVVAVGDPVTDFPCLRIDDELAVRQAVEHVIGLGHTAIGYVGSVPRQAANTRTPLSRLKEYHASMAAAGLTVREDWVLRSDWTVNVSWESVQAVLGTADRPTAFVCGSDEIAFGVLAAARRCGLKVPEDLSVIGIDDHTFSATFGLSTVRQDVLAQGHRAGELLMRQLGVVTQSAPVTPQLVFPTTLVPRESTAPPPRPS